MQENGRGASGTRAACIDAETLAAWADEGLSSAERAVVETHLADCDRCTAMLATFVRSAPDVPVAESLWKRWHLRWLVPAATAATVAALYVLAPRPESQITTLAPARTTESQSASASAPAAAATPLADAREQEAPAATTPAPATDSFAKREEPVPTPRQLAEERRADASDTSAKRLQATPSNETVASAPLLQREADRTEARSADAQSERFVPQVPSANAAPVPPSAPAEAAGAAASPPPAAAASESAFSAAGRARAVASPAPNATSVIEVVSPDPMTRWRIVGTGQVERSTNGGAQWERATMPEAATLIAGSSPSPGVCWLVGRSGSIYVTTDGLRFVRVPFPDRTDVVSIRATDGRRATVITIDGRTMRTDDQGVTWIPVAP